VALKPYSFASLIAILLFYGIFVWPSSKHRLLWWNLCSLVEQIAGSDLSEKLTRVAG
jgi:hypothetical protein